MGKNEDDKNDMLSHKYDSHTTNLLKLKIGSPEWKKEFRKQKRAQSRFWKFIKKVTRQGL